MRRKHKRNDDEVEVNITPMLDIVFILLIFFIVTTSFVKETGIQVNRPSNNPPETKKISQVIPIKIFADGRIEVRGVDTEIGGVRAGVEGGLAADPDTSVVVIADREADSGLLVRVIDQARVAGAEKVSLAAQRSK